MIRQFTTVPALLAGAAIIISACSADMPDLGDLAGGSGGSGSGSSSSGSSVSSAQGAVVQSGSLSGRIKRVLDFHPAATFDIDQFRNHFSGSFLLDDGSVVETLLTRGEHYVRTVDITDVHYIPPHLQYSGAGAILQSDNCALTKNSDVYCWGTNEYGQVGNGTFDSTLKGEKDISHQRYYIYNSFKILSEVKNLTTDSINNTFCALKFDDSVYCWGKAWYQASSTDVRLVSTPTLVPGGSENIGGTLDPFPNSLEPTTQIEYNPNDSHIKRSCEIHTSGVVTCQGHNSDKGMLFGKDNKALAYSAIPLEISGIEQAESFMDSTVRGFSVWGHTTAEALCVLRTDDKVQCWGDELDGVVTYTP